MQAFPRVLDTAWRIDQVLELKAEKILSTEHGRLYYYPLLSISNLKKKHSSNSPQDSRRRLKTTEKPDSHLWIAI
jgi:hypothetical protein